MCATPEIGNRWPSARRLEDGSAEAEPGSANAHATATRATQGGSPLTAEPPQIGPRAASCGPMDPGPALVAKLDGVIDRGSGGYDALCPVPVDGAPRLTIRTAEDGGHAPAMSASPSPVGWASRPSPTPGR